MRLHGAGKVVSWIEQRVAQAADPRRRTFNACTPAGNAF
jgi:hypothetical protein